MKIIPAETAFLKAREYWHGAKKIVYANFLYRLFNLFSPRVNERPDGRSCVFLDVSVMVKKDPHTGIQRIVRNIWQEFSCGFYDICDFVPVWASGFKRGFFMAKVSVGESEPVFTKTNQRIAVRSGDIFLALDLSPAIILTQLSTLRAIATRNVALYFIVYDLIPLIHPQYFPFGTSALHTRWQKEIIKLGTIICISRSVRNDLIAWLKDSGLSSYAESVRWFHLGYKNKNFIGQMANSLPVPEDLPCFLLVSTLEPRKGHTQTLDAFEIIWSRGIDVSLVFVGQLGWKVDALYKRISRHIQINRRLFWFRGCDDEVLGTLYRRADAVLMPSEAEGFGLALIEGAAHGKPLILRDIPVFHEIAGDHAFYFKGKGAVELADALEKWLELYRHGKQPQSTGMRVLSWQESARRLFSIIHPQAAPDMVWNGKGVM